MRRPSLHFGSLSLIVPLASHARRAKVMPAEAADGSVIWGTMGSTQIASDGSALQTGLNGFSSPVQHPPPSRNAHA